MSTAHRAPRRGTPGAREPHHSSRTRVRTTPTDHDGSDRSRQRGPVVRRGGRRANSRARGYRPGDPHVPRPMCGERTAPEGRGRFRRTARQASVRGGTRRRARRARLGDWTVAQQQLLPAARSQSQCCERTLETPLPLPAPGFGHDGITLPPLPPADGLIQLFRRLRRGRCSAQATDQRMHVDGAGTDTRRSDAAATGERATLRTPPRRCTAARSPSRSASSRTAPTPPATPTRSWSRPSPRSSRSRRRSPGSTR